MYTHLPPRPTTLGIFRTRELRLIGIHTRRTRERAMRFGKIYRVRRGWYATPDAHPDLVTAVRHYGALTSLSACKIYGLWTPPTTDIFVAVPDFVRRSRTRGVTRRHLTEKLPGPLVSLDTALIHVARYEPFETALIVFESAINKGLIQIDYARRLLTQIPITRAERLLKRLCSGSQSGSETRVRNYIQSLRFRVTPQKSINHVGRVDIFVHPRMIVECDSRAHHTSMANYQNDRSRSNSALICGFLTVRLTYEDIWLRWNETKIWIKYLLQHGFQRWKKPAYSPAS